VKYKFR